MKTRIIQPEPEQPDTSGNGAVTPPPPAHNLAARMARWSGQHRKKAIFGWFAFVLVVFFVGTNVIGQKDIADVDQFSGESGEAEQALDRAGLRPIEEVVFVQSDKLTVADPEFQGAVEDVVDRLSAIRYVENVDVAAHRRQRGLGRRPRRPGGLRDRRRLDRGEGAGRSHPRRGRRRSEGASGPRHRAVRRRQRRQGHQRGDQRRPREGGDAVPADHADHPHRSPSAPSSRRVCRC